MKLVLFNIFNNLIHALFILHSNSADLAIYLTSLSDSNINKFVATMEFLLLKAT